MESNQIKILNKRRKEPPTEIRLFKFGGNKTTKGVFYLTEENAKLIMEVQSEYKNKLNIDYNHAQLTSTNPDENISAGKYDLALLDDGLYAINIEYTDKARDYILNGEYLYISPAFSVDNDNNITSIINFALTNLPATYDIKELMAASKMADEMAEIINSENSKTNNSKSVEVKKMEIENNEVLLADPVQDLQDPEPEQAPEDQDAPSKDVTLLDLFNMLEDLSARLDALADKKLDVVSDASEVNELNELNELNESNESLSESLEDKITVLSAENEELKKEIILSTGIQAGYILPSQKNILKKLSLVDLEDSISELKNTKVSDVLNMEIKSPSPSLQTDHDFLVKKYKKIFS